VAKLKGMRRVVENQPVWTRPGGHNRRAPHQRNPGTAPPWLPHRERLHRLLVIAQNPGIRQAAQALGILSPRLYTQLAWDPGPPTDSRPLCVRGQRNMTVHSTTR
jgi:hypothetical protein